MSQFKIFFDTNVLVYAHDESSNHHTESAILLKMALENQIKGVIAEQNLIELYRILTNPTAMKGNPLTSLQAKNLITETYLSETFEVIYPNSSTTSITLEAVSSNVISARIFDVRLAALILDTNIDYFATYNISDFQNISSINPMTPEKVLAAMQA